MINWLETIFVKRARTPARVRQRVSFASDFAAIYAIGDVHGCLNELLSLEKKIVEDGLAIDGPKLIVMLGDYIDRGPSSAAVIEHLLTPLPQDYSRLCLAGNHDQMFLDFLQKPSTRSPWLALGGDETLASYGVYLDDVREHPLASQLRALVPQEHIDFLSLLPVMLCIDRYCFVHAGIDPSAPIDKQTDEVLMTSRPHEFDWMHYNGRLTVVHGHTPVPQIEVSGPRINLDIKVYESSRLAALRIQDGKLTVIFSN
jgi:serine/threonine protein phosphatase 1